MTLTETLRRQHAFVQDLVHELDGSLQARRMDEVATLLGRLKQALIEHLALEDRALYPELIRAAQEKKQDHLLGLARSFSDNMGRITEALLGFLKRYEGGIADVTTFIADWASIRGALVMRIHSEEGTLYPLFDKFCLPAAPVERAG